MEKLTINKIRFTFTNEREDKPIFHSSLTCTPEQMPGNFKAAFIRQFGPLKDAPEWKDKPEKEPDGSIWPDWWFKGVLWKTQPSIDPHPVGVCYDRPTHMILGFGDDYAIPDDGNIYVEIPNPHDESPYRTLNDCFVGKWQKAQLPEDK